MKVGDRVISICPAYSVGESGIVKGIGPDVNSIVVLLDRGDSVCFLQTELMFEGDPVILPIGEQGVLYNTTTYTSIVDEWKKEGKCTSCGELGRYSMSVPICSKHGEY